jgi:hypothetical protein
VPSIAEGSHVQNNRRRFGAKRQKNECCWIRFFAGKEQPKIRGTADEETAAPKGDAAVLLSAFED